MTVATIVLVSVKGAPGVTTAAAAIAAAAGDGAAAPDDPGVVLAELDPSGGSVQVLTGAPARWGAIDAAGRLRRRVDPSAVRDHLADAPPGVATLTAPPAAHVAASVIASGGDRWLPSLRATAAEVVVDAGRWDAAQPTAGRIQGADVVGLVCRPTVSGVESARLALDRLQAAARAPIALVVVGRKPYGTDEIAAHVDAPVAGPLAWDPRAVAALWDAGATRRWRRSSLARSAAATHAALVSLAGPAVTPAAGQPGVGAAAPPTEVAS